MRHKTRHEKRHETRDTRRDTKQDTRHETRQHKTRQNIKHKTKNKARNKKQNKNKKHTKGIYLIMRHLVWKRYKLQQLGLLIHRRNLLLFSVEFSLSAVGEVVSCRLLLLESSIQKNAQHYHIYIYMFHNGKSVLLITDCLFFFRTSLT